MPAPRNFIITKLSVLAMILLWLAQIVMSNRLATSGEYLSGLEQQIVNLEEINQNLQQRVDAQISLQYLTEQASMMGLYERPKIMSLALPGELASTQ